MRCGADCGGTFACHMVGFHLGIICVGKKGPLRLRDSISLLHALPVLSQENLHSEFSLFSHLRSVSDQSINPNLHFRSSWKPSLCPYFTTVVVRVPFRYLCKKLNLSSEPALYAIDSNAAVLAFRICAPFGQASPQPAIDTARNPRRPQRPRRPPHRPDPPCSPILIL